jgi:hypothetical protein
MQGNDFAIFKFGDEVFSTESEKFVRRWWMIGVEVFGNEVAEAGIQFSDFGIPGAQFNFGKTNDLVGGWRSNG